MVDFVPIIWRFMRSNFAKIFLMAWLLSACGAPPRPTVRTGTLEVKATPTATAFITPLPSMTVSPRPPSTPQPSATPNPTLTLTVTPTLFPLTIAALRLRAYPGSELKIEETLQPGFNYDRYIASYLSDGLKIYALLTVPRGSRPASGWPAIIFNHGYIPPEVYTPTGYYVEHVDYLARQGYIVLKPDFRGHGKSEGTAKGAYATPDYIVDDLNALASLKRFPSVDPARIGMFAHSMGGHITLGAMVISKEIKAGVIWAGVVAPYPDLLKWYPTPPATLSDGAFSWREPFIQTFGSPAENPSFWASISPSTFIQDLSGPLQLHHGIQDSDVPYQYSLDLYNALKAAGKTVDFYTYPGSDHNLYGRAFGDAIYRTLQFFNQYVKGVAPTSP